MAVETWVTFALLWIAFAGFPGPNAAYAMAVGSRRGAGAGMFAALGFSLAVVVYVTLVAAGLLAVLATTAEVFDLLRWAGVAYLLYLGLRTWTAETDVGPPPPLGPRQAGGILSRASLISLTNPKSALTYVMVYPAFMTGGPDASGELLVLGTTSVVISFLVYSTYGLLASRIGRLIRTRRQAVIRNRAFAILFIGTSAALAFAGRR